MICDQCETVAHCLKNGCVPKQPTKDEALKLALEALEELAALMDATRKGQYRPDIFTTQPARTAITAIKQALAAPAQEPVAIVDEAGVIVVCNYKYKPGDKLYTTPPNVATPLDETASLAAPVQEPVGCEGAIVNGRIYADRLEHDYQFECEAGPLHLCTDWVEFRRCFEWLVEHLTPPAAQRQWVGLTDDEFRDFASTLDYGTGGLIRAIEAKLKEKNT